MQNKRVIELFDKRFDVFTEDIYNMRQSILQEVTPFNITNARLETMMNWWNAEAFIEDWVFATRRHDENTLGGVLNSYQVDRFINEIQKESMEDCVMQLDDYQVLAARTMNKEMDDWETEQHALHGMVSEIGELHGLYQKAYQGHDIDPEHTKKELGDLMWFICEFCTVNKWNLSDIAKMNIEKLRKRYPNGFDVEHSLHRAEGDI